MRRYEWIKSLKKIVEAMDRNKLEARPLRAIGLRTLSNFFANRVALRELLITMRNASYSGHCMRAAACLQALTDNVLAALDHFLRDLLP